MDNVKKFTTNELIILGGCVLMIIGYFMKWIGVDLGFAEASVSGSHYFLQGTLPLLFSLVLGGAIIVTRLSPSTKIPELPVPWNQALLIVAGVNAVLVVSRLIMGDSGLDRKIGLFIASIGVILQVVGAFLKYQAKEEDAAPAGGATPPSSF